MSIRTGDKVRLRELGTYDANDTWYQCDQDIKVWGAGDQIRLYINNSVADAGEVCFKIQVQDLDNEWCDIYGGGAVWCSRFMLAGERVTMNLNGAGLTANDLVRVFFKCEYNAGLAEIGIQGLAHTAEMWSGPALEKSGGMPITIQDQTTQSFDLYFAQAVTAPSTLIVDAIPDSYTFDVTAGHGLSIGDFVGIFGAKRFFWATIKALPSTTTVQVDSPVDYPFESGSTVIGTTIDMDVDGSVTRQIFQIGPVGVSQDFKIDITRIMLVMTSATSMDDEKFGGIPRLTNGVVLRQSNGHLQNYWNAKANSDFALLSFDTVYSDKAPAGFYGVRVRYTFAGQDKHGVAVRLKSGDTLELLLHDDLTGLTRFYGMAQGHVVTD